MNWVHNLRAAGEGTLTVNKRQESIRAVALSKDEATAFFNDVLAPYVRGLPPLVRGILPSILGLRDVLDDPAAAAERHPVFEIHEA